MKNMMKRQHDEIMDTNMFNLNLSIEIRMKKQNRYKHRNYVSCYPVNRNMPYPLIRQHKLEYMTFYITLN